MLYDTPKLTQSTPNQALAFGVQYGTRNESGWSASAARKLSTDPSVTVDTPPLSCRLYRLDGGAYSVIVTDGTVIEVKQTYKTPPLAEGEEGLDDSIKEWSVIGTRADAPSTLYREYNMVVGETIGVEFPVNARGEITDYPQIVVKAAGEDKSKHYTPIAGADETGAVGTCYYVLAKLTSDEEVRLDIYHAGSNIDYVRDLPVFAHAGGETSEAIILKYDLEAGEYKCRGIKGGEGIDVTATDDEITIAASGASHPFKLVVIPTTVGETVQQRLYVHYGRATAFVWGPDSPTMTAAEIPIITFNSGRLLNDAFSGSSDGFSVLDNAVTYGVWLQVDLAKRFGTAPSETGYTTAMAIQGDLGAAVINVSSYYYAPANGPAFSNTIPSKPAMIFIGRVTVTDGVAFIQQYRRSDVVIPIATFGYGTPEP